MVQDYDNNDENFKNLYGYLFKPENLQAVKGLHWLPIPFLRYLTSSRCFQQIHF